MALQVLGTGMGRTGTHSLKIALEQLGFGKCYHMIELFEHPENLVYFNKAEQGEVVNWDELFEGYLSAVDCKNQRFKFMRKKYLCLRAAHQAFWLSSLYLLQL